MVKRTILVETRTRELLKELGKKAQTYDGNCDLTMGLNFCSQPTKLPRELKKGQVGQSSQHEHISGQSSGESGS
jgi:hypothetical protein